MKKQLTVRGGSSFQISAVQNTHGTILFIHNTHMLGVYVRGRVTMVCYQLCLSVFIHIFVLCLFLITTQR